MICTARLRSVAAMEGQPRAALPANTLLTMTISASAQHTLYYAHDPMCSWCWGFKPHWHNLQQALPATINTRYVLGGLAPDSNEPMPEAMQQMLQQVWHRIAQTIPGTQFNHDFWTLNKPRRSTYPACRAVLAATAQNDAFEELMITAIQQAYYLHAKNPSDDDVLISLADSIGCDVNAFKQLLHSPENMNALQDNILFAHGLGAQGFPSLFFEAVGKTPVQIALSYSDTQSVLEQIDSAIAA